MHAQRIRPALAILLLACASCARTQTPSSPSAPHAFASALSASDTVEVIREIDDPSTGNRWLLVRDWNRPGGPGRLLLLAGSLRTTHPEPAGQISPSLAGTEFNTAAPVIRGGDPLIVEENTPLVEARLAATALGPAVRGAALEARLQIGGKIVRVRALAPGRAALAPGLEGQP